MALFQILPAGAAEPILQTGAILGGGGIIVWFAHAMMEVRDIARSMNQKITDPHVGLSVIVDRHNKEIEIHTARGTAWVASLNAVEDRLTRVEQTCRTTHQTPRKGRNTPL